MAVKGMAIPLLVGTGVQIMGAKQGWDPRFTALASIAAGGIGAGMAGGAFAGGTAAQAAIAPTATGAVWNPTTVGQGLASSAVPSAASTGALWNPTTVGQGVVGNMNYAQNISPAYSAVDAVKSPFFDRNQYEWQTEKVTNADGTTGLKRTKVPVFDDAGNPVQGMSAADALGINMADTFLKYELALAQQPKPRPVRSGGGGGGSGGPMAPAYNGGGGSGQKQVTWGFGGGNNNGYQPQGLV